MRILAVIALFFSITKAEAFTIEFEIKKIVSCLIEHKFPELKKINLVYEKLDSPSVFLATELKRKTLLGPKEKRIYILQYNPLLEVLNPSKKGLVAILAHELAHFQDYESLSSAKMITKFGRYFISAKFRAKVERSIDVVALQKGYSYGLIQYRKWLYKNIPRKDIKTKFRNYYTPKEIRNYVYKNGQGEKPACYDL